jgi:hypothetical protein
MCTQLGWEIYEKGHFVNIGMDGCVTSIKLLLAKYSVKL